MITCRRFSFFFLFIYFSFQFTKKTKMELFSRSVPIFYTLYSVLPLLHLPGFTESFFLGKSTSKLENPVYLNHSYANLSSFPNSTFFKQENSPSSPGKTLDLSYNNIEHVPVINLLDADSIFSLNLSHNKIKTIAAFAFKNLSNLVELDLSYNCLEGSNINGKDISKNEMGSFQKLKKLRFQGNPFGYVQEFTFTSFEFNRLEYLDLSNCSIKTLEDLSIDSLMRLKFLNLSYNHLSQLGSASFTGLSELEVLDLSFNKLRVIGDLPLLTSLKYLHLDHNIITIIRDNVIYNSAVNLHTLSLKRNNMRTMNRLTLPLDQLQKVYLEDNPWTCDCRMKWILSGLENGLKNKSSPIICTYPSMYRGQDIFNLSSEDLTCERSFLGALAALLLSATLALIFGAIFIILWRKRNEFRCFTQKGGDYTAVYTRDHEADEENATVTFSDEKSLVNGNEST